MTLWVKMDRALAANIPVSCLTLRVRKEIAKYLDVVDGVNGQRDYFGLGIHLLDLDLQDIKVDTNIKRQIYTHVYTIIYTHRYDYTLKDKV